MLVLMRELVFLACKFPPSFLARATFLLKTANAAVRSLSSSSLLSLSCMAHKDVFVPSTSSALSRAMDACPTSTSCRSFFRRTFGITYHSHLRWDKDEVGAQTSAPGYALARLLQANLPQADYLMHDVADATTVRGASTQVSTPNFSCTVGSM